MALLIALFLSLRTKPKEINDSNVMFFVCLAAANMPIFMQLSGVTIVGPHINATVKQVGSVMSVAAIPFYLAAVVNLGETFRSCRRRAPCRRAGCIDFLDTPCIQRTFTGTFFR